MKKELRKWIDKTVYLDSETEQRRTLIHDIDRDRTFFFSEQMDFDKDDNMVARYWLDECEGWKDEWKQEVIDVYTD